MLGYMENLGLSKELDYENIYFNKNGFSNIKRMFRIEPEFTYNIGKFTVGMEYMLTGAHYGTFLSGQGDDVEKVISAAKRGMATGNLHWVLNHRLQALVKFTF